LSLLRARLTRQCHQPLAAFFEQRLAATGPRRMAVRQNGQPG
jgi:hypothetical protein